MKSNREYKHQDPSFSLYEKTFASLIEQSRHIIIWYQPPAGTLPDNYASDSIICSVNGCASPDEFRKKLTSMMELSVLAVLDSLESTDNSHRQAQFEHLRMKVSGLKDIIGEESVTLKDDFGEYVCSNLFKCFKNFCFEGSTEGYSLQCNHSIHLTIDKFAEVWLEIISSALELLDILWEIMIIQQPVDLKTKDFKLKFILTFSEIWNMFRNPMVILVQKLFHR